jgi:hypothetical protein
LALYLTKGEPATMRDLFRRSLIGGLTALAAGSALNRVAAQSSPVPFGQTKIGTPTILYNESGDETARITLTEYVDPFQDWSDYGAPQRGERFILATVQIEATGARPFEFSTYDFGLLEDIGILYNLGYVSRSDASMVSHPDLEDTTMLPGETVTGSLSFDVPEVAVISQLIYSGYGDQNSFLYAIANVEQGQ